MTSTMLPVKPATGRSGDGDPPFRRWTRNRFSARDGVHAHGDQTSGSVTSSDPSAHHVW